MMHMRPQQARDPQIGDQQQILVAKPKRLHPKNLRINIAGGVQVKRHIIQIVAANHVCIRKLYN